MRERSVNLLSGGIALALGRLALPIMATSLIQMAYNLIDIFWVSRLGPQAVAAVGTGGLFLWLSEGLMYFARMGGQVLSAQALGARRFAQARRYAAASLQIGLVLGILYGLTLIFLRVPLVAFFHFNETETIGMSQDYTGIVGFGVVFSYVAGIITGLMAASGNSHTPFVVTTIGLVLNMILDPLCIFILGWGLSGAAIATVVAQVVVVLLFIRASARVPLLRRLSLWQYCGGAYKAIVRIGIPSGVETLIYAGTLIVLSRFVTSFGDAAVAVQRVGGQVESLSWLTADGLAVAINAFIAQNYGAGNLRRAKSGYHAALVYSVAFGGFATLLFFCLPSELMGLFFSDLTARGIGASYLRVMAFSQILMCLEIMTMGAFAGYGQTLFPAILAGILTAARIPLALLFTSSGMGLDGIWWAISVSSMAKGTLLLGSFLIYRGRLARRAIKHA